MEELFVVIIVIVIVIIILSLCLKCKIFSSGSYTLNYTKLNAFQEQESSEPKYEHERVKDRLCKATFPASFNARLKKKKKNHVCIAEKLIWTRKKILEINFLHPSWKVLEKQVMSGLLAGHNLEARTI